jgi:DNA-binding transcriptional regulator YhcF (GntR family)
MPNERPTESVSRLLVLDRTSPVPLYFQVAQSLERAISDGTLPPGTRLENEVALAESLGLSRPTMRRAMQYLVDKGVLVRRRGVGTRVVQPKVRRPLGLSSLYEDLLNSGQRPTTKVLSLTTEPASAAIAEALSVPVDTPCTVLVRLRSAADRPIARMSNHLPHTIPGMAGGLSVEVRAPITWSAACSWTPSERISWYSPWASTSSTDSPPAMPGMVCGRWLLMRAIGRSAAERSRTSTVHGVSTGTDSASAIAAEAGSVVSESTVVVGRWPLLSRSS